jgi:putative phage-type endonuclease
VELEQGTDEWLDWRKQGVTATEVASAVAKHNFDDIVNNKLGLGTPWNPPPQVKMAMDVGTILEPYARDYANKVLGMAFEPVCAESVEFPFMRVSLDGLVEVDGRWHGLEVKCGKSYSTKFAQSGKPCDYVMTQIQYQMLVCGLSEMNLIYHHNLPNDTDAALSVLYQFSQKSITVAEWGSKKPTIIQVTADKDFQALLKHIAQIIHARVQLALMS